MGRYISIQENKTHHWMDESVKKSCTLYPRKVLSSASGAFDIVPMHWSRKAISIERER
jgi:hypothetical protein